jgi:hypothetical protein
MNDLENLTPDQRKQFERMLDQYPQLDDKKRELNTPFMQDKAKAGKPKLDTRSHTTAQPQPLIPQRPLDDDSILDYNSFDTPPMMAEEENVVFRKPKNMASVTVDPDNKLFKKSFDDEEDLENDRENAARQKQQFIRKNNIVVDEQNKRHIEEKRIPFSTEGKEHPILSKMRASLGMVDRADYRTVEIGGIKYTFKRVTREELARVTGFTSFRSSNGEEFATNVETAILAWAIQDIDGVPKEDVFNIGEKETDTDGKTKYLTSLQKKDKASEEMYRFINSSPNELSQALSAYYEQEFPSVGLLGPNRTFAICPEENCTFKRIVTRGEAGYCTYHGAELVQEGDIPNPSSTTP